MLLSHAFNFGGTASVQPVENMDEKIRKYLQYLIVMLTDGHLQIKPREFTQMPSGVRILRPKDGSSLKNAFEATTRRGDLFVKLGGHGQTGGFAEIIELEDIGPALGTAPDELGGVDLDEILGYQTLPEERPDHALHAEDRLVRRGAEIDPAVIQSHLLPHPDQPVRRGHLLAGVRTNVRLLFEIGSARVLHQKWEVGGSLAHAVQFRNLDLHHFLGGAVDGIVGDGDNALHVHHRFHGESANVFHHLFGYGG
mmetsp:Transcript_33837/g.39195  ORF Transcript_33837/g.39195 Transcript_33837/m.39195 type:complete len:253 (+) Transcript_33837:856-1614(+)